MTNISLGPEPVPESYLINGANGTPCNTADPMCTCGPFIGHSWLVKAVKLSDGIWYQNPHTWATAPGSCAPTFSWADHGPMRFASYNNPLNPPTPWWNPGGGGYYSGWGWNVHPYFHATYIGNTIHNPWEDAFYDWVVASLGGTPLSIGQKISLPFTNAIDAYFIGTHFGLFDLSEPMNGNLNSGDLDVTDFCIEYVGIQQSYFGWYNEFDTPSNSNCASLSSGPQGCAHPCAVLSIGNGTIGSDTLVITDPDTGNATYINDPLISNGEIAKHGNIFWILKHGTFRIEEFVIDTNDCSVFHLRTIPLPPSWFTAGQGLTTVAGMAAKDQTTLIVGSVDYISGSGGDFYEIDISGNTPTWNLLFNSEGRVVGDLVYNPVDNTIASFEFLATWGNYGSRARHYDYNTGALLGEVDWADADYGNAQTGMSMFCYNGKIMINSHHDSDPADVMPWWFNTNIYTLTQAPISGMITAGDQASSSSCCGDEVILGDDDKIPCYKIGDITDPADGLGGAGGMVFALPNIPPNHTPYYYEVALDDLSIGTTPVDSLIIDNVFPFTQTAFPDGQHECGHEVPAQPQAQLCFPISLADPTLYPIDTTIGNMQARYPFGAGAPIDSCNPSGANISSITAPAPVTGIDFNNNSVWPGGASPMLLSIEFIPANSATVPTTGQAVMSLPYNSYLFEFDTPMSNLTSALYLKQLDVLGGPGTQQPFSTTGAEWGAYNDQLTLSTSVDFGEGLNNTNNILAQPATPVWLTHDVAANLCSAYNPVGSAPDRWFLPSLMEFHAIYTNVGPGTPHAAALNLHPQVEDLQDTYWTSSSLTGFIPDPTSSATTPPLIGGPSGTFSDPFAWAYNTHDPIVPYPITISQNLPVGPNVITRCSTLSVRPVRRFECIEPVPLECPDDCAIVYCFRDTLSTLVEIRLRQSITSTPISLLFNGYNDTADWEQFLGTSPIHNQPWTILEEIAKYNNTIWMYLTTSYAVSEWAIIEFTIGSDCTQLELKKILDLPSGWNAWTGLCAKTPDTLVGVGRSGVHKVVEIDVSGATGSNALLTPQFDTPNVMPGCTNAHPFWDSAWLGQSNHIIGVNACGDITVVDYATGNLIAQQNFPQINSYSIFCYQGDTYIANVPGGQTTVELLKVSCPAGTIIVDFGNPISAEKTWGDAASSPYCCGEVGPLDCTALSPGDVGPAGGIIVAVPYMNINDPSNGIVGPIIQPLQGQQMIKNPTKYYYEISPTNLNSTGEFDNYTGNCAPTTFDSAQWGSYNIDVANLGNYIDYWTPENNYYSYTGVFFTNEFQGEGEQATYDMLALNMNVMCNPPNPYTQVGCNGIGYDLTPKWVFEMCGNYVLNGYDDWFLPSTREMQWARNYTPPGTLYDSTDGMAVVNSYGPQPNYEPYYHYWTCNTDDDEGNFDMNLSGHTYDPLSLTDNESAFTVSMGPIDTLNASPDGENWRTKTHRCHNNNVRAMRRFECDEDPCADPLNLDCSCIEYNYRDGVFVNTFGLANSPTGHCLFNNMGWIPDGNGGWTTNLNLTDNLIGDTYFEMRISSRDVKGNNWAPNDWMDDSLGYTITLWSRDFELIGKWHYNKLIDYLWQPEADTLIDVIRPQIKLKLAGVTHLAGSNPVADVGVLFGGGTSITHCYIKLEAACTSGNTNFFEDGCVNSNIWGGSSFPPYGNSNYIPHVCDPNNPGVYPSGDCFPTWGTHPHYDYLGNSLTVTSLGAWGAYNECTTLGCSGGSSSLAPPTEMGDIKIFEGNEKEIFELDKKPSIKSPIIKEQNELKEEKGNARRLY